MISVEEALDRVFALVTPLGAEPVPLAEANGRVLAADVAAARAQPPFDASAMDGYAIRGLSAGPGARFRVIGEAGAGHAFSGRIGPGEALRIFTGAPMPDGADRVVIQEDVSRDGDSIVLGDKLDSGTNIRPCGGDFPAGFRMTAPRRLRPHDLALLASMNVPLVPVTRRPVVALIATGDELVMPGENPRPDQIIASNTFALKALVEAEGGQARMLPIARDTEAELAQVLGMAAGADLIVTVGGASVGDHDLVGKVAGDLGMERAFYKIAMRPGKPLMAGRLGDAAMLGLPGNPVSAIVCAHLFMLPMLRAMLGLGTEAPPRARAVLAADVGPTGPRMHFMRARLTPGDDLPRITPFDRQDSSLLGVLSAADALLIRPLGDIARPAGTEVAYLPL
ncbi:MAG: molybdopterin molybdenumtransferase MoeA [Rhodobacteraceae bacterium]|nr:molybdopterin molybdenumtransferase MoeA [Paracoccaceae bacterium]